jgi:hypothetical protein
MARLACLLIILTVVAGVAYVGWLKQACPPRWLGTHECLWFRRICNAFRWSYGPVCGLSGGFHDCMRA